MANFSHGFWLVGGTAANQLEAMLDNFCYSILTGNHASNTVFLTKILTVSPDNTNELNSKLTGNVTPIFRLQKVEFPYLSSNNLNVNVN